VPEINNYVLNFQGRPLMRANKATERHAGKIYTRAMFEQFGHILYECGAYQVEELEKGEYVAIHTDVERREKWCRTSYKVKVIEPGELFDCECGQFAHMGLLCSHVLKVRNKKNGRNGFALVLECCTYWLDQTEHSLFCISAGT
jgi:hypothetical protein